MNEDKNQHCIRHMTGSISSRARLQNENLKGRRPKIKNAMTIPKKAISLQNYTHVKLHRTKFGDIFF